MISISKPSNIFEASLTNFINIFTPRDVFDDNNIGMFFDASSILFKSFSSYPVVANTTGVLFFRAYDNIGSKVS